MTTSGSEDEIRRLLHGGFAALTEGRFDAAENACRRVLSLDQRCVAEHFVFLVGLIAAEQHDRKTAVSAFGLVTRLQPNHVAAWAQLARHLAQDNLAVPKLRWPRRCASARSIRSCRI